MNCETLYGIGCIPSGNYIRAMLDEASPALLEPCFRQVQSLLEHEELRQKFARLDGRTLVAWDGTEYFNSYTLDCPQCIRRKR